MNPKTTYSSMHEWLHAGTYSCNMSHRSHLHTLNSLNYRLYLRHCHTSNEIRHAETNLFTSLVLAWSCMTKHPFWPMACPGELWDANVSAESGPRMPCHCCATCGSMLFWVIVLWRDLSVFVPCAHTVLLPISMMNEFSTYRCERCALNPLIVGGMMFLNIPSNVKYTLISNTYYIV